MAAEQQLSAAEARIAELQDRLRAVEASAPDTQPRPPAMAGPGDMAVTVCETDRRFPYVRSLDICISVSVHMHVFLT